GQRQLHAERRGAELQWLDRWRWWHRYAGCDRWDQRLGGDRCERRHAQCDDDLLGDHEPDGWLWHRHGDGHRRRRLDLDQRCERRFSRVDELHQHGSPRRRAGQRQLHAERRGAELQWLDRWRWWHRYAGCDRWDQRLGGDRCERRHAQCDDDLLGDHEPDGWLWHRHGDGHRRRRLDLDQRCERRFSRVDELHQHGSPRRRAGQRQLHAERRGAELQWLDRWRWWHRYAGCDRWDQRLGGDRCERRHAQCDDDLLGDHEPDGWLWHRHGDGHRRRRLDLDQRCERRFSRVDELHQHGSPRRRAGQRQLHAERRGAELQWLDRWRWWHRYAGCDRWDQRLGGDRCERRHAQCDDDLLGDHEPDGWLWHRHGDGHRRRRLDLDQRCERRFSRVDELHQHGSPRRRAGQRQLHAERRGAELQWLDRWRWWHRYAGCDRWDQRLGGDRCERRHAQCDDDLLGDHEPDGWLWHRHGDGHRRRRRVRDQRCERRFSRVDELHQHGSPRRRAGQRQLHAERRGAELQWLDRWRWWHRYAGCDRWDQRLGGDRCERRHAQCDDDLLGDHEPDGWLWHRHGDGHRRRRRVRDQRCERRFSRVDELHQHGSPRRRAGQRQLHAERGGAELQWLDCWRWWHRYARCDRWDQRLGGDRCERRHAQCDDDLLGDHEPDGWLWHRHGDGHRRRRRVRDQRCERRFSRVDELHQHGSPRRRAGQRQLHAERGGAELQWLDCWRWWHRYARCDRWDQRLGGDRCERRHAQCDDDLLGDHEPDGWLWHRHGDGHRRRRRVRDQRCERRFSRVDELHQHGSPRRRAGQRQLHAERGGAELQWLDCWRWWHRYARCDRWDQRLGGDRCERRHAQCDDDLLGDHEPDGWLWHRHGDGHRRRRLDLDQRCERRFSRVDELHQHGSPRRRAGQRQLHAERRGAELQWLDRWRWWHRYAGCDRWDQRLGGDRCERRHAQCDDDLLGDHEPDGWLWHRHGDGHRRRRLDLDQRCERRFSRVDELHQHGSPRRRAGQRQLHAERRGAELQWLDRWRWWHRYAGCDRWDQRLGGDRCERRHAQCDDDLLGDHEPDGWLWHRHGDGHRRRRRVRDQRCERRFSRVDELHQHGSPRRRAGQRQLHAERRGAELQWLDRWRWWHRYAGCDRWDQRLGGDRCERRHAQCDDDLLGDHEPDGWLWHRHGDGHRRRRRVRDQRCERRFSRVDELHQHGSPRRRAGQRQLHAERRGAELQWLDRWRWWHRYAGCDRWDQRLGGDRCERRHAQCDDDLLGDHEPDGWLWHRHGDGHRRRRRVRDQRCERRFSRVDELHQHGSPRRRAGQRQLHAERGGAELQWLDCWRWWHRYARCDRWDQRLGGDRCERRHAQCDDDLLGDHEPDGWLWHRHGDGHRRRRRVRDQRCERRFSRVDELHQHGSPRRRAGQRQLHAERRGAELQWLDRWRWWHRYAGCDRWDQRLGGDRCERRHAQCDDDLLGDHEPDGWLWHRHGDGHRRRRRVRDQRCERRFSRVDELHQHGSPRRRAGQRQLHAERRGAELQWLDRWRWWHRYAGCDRWDQRLGGDRCERRQAQCDD